ncbi:hypothetical protein LCGC14_2507110 [marine sediment metagenome]|uniref:Uncharacterized protein n=1 Tax=marine sediment metagenome TaxID=412755 RepID=A0A0F9DTU4_9ZZZZ|nr:hypothetical protein [Actinomycetota bacterium]
MPMLIEPPQLLSMLVPLMRGVFLVPSLIAELLVSHESAGSAIGIITGLGIHMMLGAFYGIVFAALYTLITRRNGLSESLLLGLGYGFALWVVNFLAIGPIIGAPPTVEVGAGTAIRLHLIFGSVAGIYLFLLQSENA